MKERWNLWIHKSCNGSFTVEAVFVIPIVLFVLFALIYMSFYLHDECVLQSVSDQLVSELSHVKEKETVIKEAVYENMDEQSTILGMFLSQEKKRRINEVLKNSVSSRLFLFRYMGCDISVHLGWLTLTSYAESVMRMPFIDALLPGQRVEIVSLGKVHDPAVAVRYGKMIYDEFEKTRLFSTLENYIEKAEDYIK